MKPYAEIWVVKRKQLLKSSRRGGEQRNNLPCLRASLKPEDIQRLSNLLCFPMLGTPLPPGRSAAPQELRRLEGHTQNMVKWGHIHQLHTRSNYFA